jgi:hypothetical protein
MTATASKIDAILPKLARLLRRLGPGTTDGEIVATVYAMRSLLDKNGADFHDLTARIETPASGLHLEEMEELYSVAYAQAKQDLQQKRAKALAACGMRADGSQDWEAIAVYCQRRKTRLLPKHHEFIDDMAASMTWGREPSERQGKYLLSLFRQIGGKMREDDK